jgi:hypothetical protein
MSEYETETDGFEDGGHVEPESHGAVEPAYDYDSVYEQARQDALEEARLNTEAAIEQSIEPIRAGYEQLMSERNQAAAAAEFHEILDEADVPEDAREGVYALALEMVFDHVAEQVAVRTGHDLDRVRWALQQNDKLRQDYYEQVLSDAAASQIAKDAAQAYRWENGGREQFYRGGGTVAGAFAKAAAGSLPGVAAGSVDYRGGKTVASRFSGRSPT